MSDFVLAADLPLADALRTAALAETARARAALQRGAAKDVHEMRKSSKRLRAWARLLRDADGDAEPDARRLNDLLRDAAQALGKQREAKVALETFAALRRPAAIAVADWAHIGTKLEQDLRRLGTRIGAELRRNAAAALATAQEAIGSLVPAGLPLRRLQKAVAKSQQACDKALQRARQQPQAERLHELRKRVKRLGYQQDLLEPRLSPATPARGLKALGEKLGTHHDLHCLQQRLESEPDRYGGELRLYRLHEVIRRRQQLLEQQIFAGGKKLFG